MRSKTMIIVVVLVTLAFEVGRLSAKTPNTLSGPGATDSYTLEDVYNRLNDGTAGSQSTFTEPGVAPASTMHTLNEIMAKAPAVDTNGATQAHVLAGKTFWGLTSAQWGPKTGTIPDNEGDNASTAQSASGGVNYFTAPEGYYDGDDTVTATDAQVAALDTDIISGNIKSGVTIFGQAGDLHDSCTCTCAKCSLNGTRWCDNGNGTVTDLTTCLVWLKQADWIGQKVWLDCDSHNDAHTAAGTLCPTNCPGLSDGSYVGDWRLPTRTELRVLTHGTEPVSSYNPRAFTGIQLDYYWTSTTTTAYPSPLTSAWTVDLRDGSYLYSSTSKTNSRWVWPVRDGQ
jgi:hypothetical protein